MAKKAPKQLSFFPPQSLSFGGTLLKNAHARSARPLKQKQLVHLVLKSEIAEGDLRFTKKKERVDTILKSQLDKYRIEIRKIAIASNHIHLLIIFKNRRLYFNWIRRVTGVIARLMLNAEKGRPSTKKFWTYRPFTRIVFWGKDMRGVIDYIQQNLLEAIGFIAYVPRKYKIHSNTC